MEIFLDSLSFWILPAEYLVKYVKIQNFYTLEWFSDWL